MQRNSITLYQYAGFLFVVGLASVFYNPATRDAGWNAHGLTGLYISGGAAAVVGLFGYLNAKGQGWAAWAGLAVAFLLVAVGGSKAFTLLRNVETESAKLLLDRLKEGIPLRPEDADRAIYYRAGLLLAMTVFSLSAFMRLGLALRRGPAA